MDARQQLAQVIAQLTMVSHAPTQHLDGGSRSSDDDPLGRKPPGGIDHEGDRPDVQGHVFRQKSAEVFIRRAKRCQTNRDYEAVLVDARAALTAWKHTPVLQGQDPEFGSLAWKRMIAASSKPDAELARLHGCSRMYIWRIKRDYSEQAA